MMGSGGMNFREIVHVIRIQKAMYDPKRVSLIVSVLKLAFVRSALQIQPPLIIEPVKFAFTSFDVWAFQRFCLSEQISFHNSRAARVSFDKPCQPQPVNSHCLL